jgi:4-hydroxy-tetrahydrodipicolinate synthase
VGLERPRSTDPRRVTPSLWGMLPTPFSLDGQELDLASLRRIAVAHVSSGCTGLVVLGVVGEPGDLSDDEKAVVITTVASAGVVPVIAGIMTLDTERAIGEAVRVKGLPLAGLLLPVTTADEAAFRSHLIAMHSASGLPIMVQDYEGYSGVRMPVESLARSIAGLEFIMGIKNETAPTFWRIRQLARLTNVPLIGGLGGIGLIDDMRAGAAGMASGISRPDVLASALAAWTAGDERGAENAIAALHP